jgi:hypothetical protein
MKTLVSRPVVAISLAVIAALSAAVPEARAQFTTGTIFGTGLGSTPGGRDSNWQIVALPTGFTPPSSQTTPYDSYVPYTAVPGAFVGGGSPQAGLVYLGGTNYWIAPQATTASLVPGTYNWIAQQQFYVPVAGFYRFDFPGAGDNELEFYIDGSINTTDALRPTITGGQQIGGRAGTFSYMSTFTGGAQLSSGTHIASMVLWDYGGETGALIGSSTFAPAVAYWAPGSGAGGNGTWTNTNAYWTTDAAGQTTKQPWTNGVGVAYFGGTSGTVTVGGNVNVTNVYFTTGNYRIQGGGGTISYDNGGTITGQTGTSTIAAPQSAPYGLKIAGGGVVVLSGTTSLGFGRTMLVDGGNLLVNGLVSSPFADAAVYVSTGSLGGTGRIDGTIAGSGRLNPGLSGTASGILTATALNPEDGLDLTFVFSGTVPTFGSAADSMNDLVRLTGATPFSTALNSSNSKTLFLNFTKAELTLGTALKGGFFTDLASDFTSYLNNQTWDNGGFEVYVLGDGQGTDNVINGQGYYNWRNPAMFGWDQSLFLTTTPQTADFGSGNVNGRIMTLVVGVPEPSTYAMGVCGVGFLGLVQWSRRRRSNRAGRALGPGVNPTRRDSEVA